MCNRQKRESLFTKKYKWFKRGRSSWCHACCKKYSKEYRERNKVRIKSKEFWNHVKYQYGLSKAADYLDRFDSANS